MLFNKKASLEISIQAIVIVVLAMTLLGLGLGFIKGMFKNIGSTTEDVSEQVRQRVLDDLVSSDKKVSFPKTEVIVDKGSATVLTVGIRNKEDLDLTYRLRFKAVSHQDSTGAINPLSEDGLESWFQYETTDYTLKAADSDIRNIRINVPKSAASGSYFLVFEVTDESEANKIYAQKDFFINVKG